MIFSKPASVFITCYGHPINSKAFTLIIRLTLNNTPTNAIVIVFAELRKHGTCGRCSLDTKSAVKLTIGLRRHSYNVDEGRYGPFWFQAISIFFIMVTVKIEVAIETKKG